MTTSGGDALDVTQELEVTLDYSALRDMLASDSEFIALLVGSSAFQQAVQITATNVSRNTFTSNIRRLRNLAGNKVVPNPPPSIFPPG